MVLGGRAMSYFSKGWRARRLVFVERVWQWMHSGRIQDDSLEFVLRLAMMNIRSCPQKIFCRLLLMILPSQISVFFDSISAMAITAHGVFRDLRASFRSRVHRDRSAPLPWRPSDHLVHLPRWPGQHPESSLKSCRNLCWLVPLHL